MTPLHATFLTILLAIAAFAVSPAKAGDESKKEQDEKTTAETKTPAEQGEAKASVAIGGKDFKYTVKTGLTPVFMSNEDDPDAHIFSTSYLLEKGGRERPVLFLFNGGPGSSSATLHAGSFAPMILAPKDAGLELAPPPYKFEPNPHSLLDVVDLVFVDPVGTGFSRVPKDGGDKDKEAKASDGKKMKAEDFWKVDTDFKSIAEFVRVWLLENDRWGAKVFVGGESYGGLRAAGMADALGKLGIAPSGILLISPALSYKDVIGMPGTPLVYANLVPTLTAVAHYHGRLGDDLQSLPREQAVAQAYEWACGEYITGLIQGNRATPAEQDRLAAELSRFTGIDVRDVKTENLMLDLDRFSSLLLRDEERYVSAYDGRIKGVGRKYAYEEDPAFALTGEPYATAFMRYLTETVGIKPKRGYEFLSYDVNRHWDFTLGKKGLEGLVGTENLLAGSMRRLPYLRVFVAMGRYDMVTPPESARQALSRMDVPRERLEKNLEEEVYEGGHMMYLNPEALEKLSRDVRAWLKGEGK